MLRPYQLDARNAIIENWRDRDTTLLVMPTGTGKTIVISDVLRARFPYRAMVLAHRKELIFQARDKIERFGGLSVEIEMGEYKSVATGGLFRRSSVVVSTIQTHVAGGDGGGRMGKFDPMDFRTLVVDEAHHAVSPSYQRVIDYYRTNPNLKVLGVTATPDRSDEEALGQVFDTVAFDYEIIDAIHDGWLVPIEQIMVNVGSLDYSRVRSTAGDLNGADLNAVLEAEKNLHGIASPSIEIIGDRRALVFTAGVIQAKELSEIFNRHRPGMSAWVCGSTDPNERIKINSDFDCGKIQVLCNCGTHTEGYDSPGVEVIIMARPTKSRSLYAQMVGRSTRPLPGVVDGFSRMYNLTTATGRKLAIASSPKASCLIVDFVGNSGKHKLITTADLLGGNVSEAAIESAIIRARSGKQMRMDITLEEEQKREDEKEARRLAEEARKHKIKVSAPYSTSAVDPFNVLQLSPVVPRGWDKDKQFTEKQRGFLKRQGINPDKIEYAKGKQLIGELMHRLEHKLATFSQAKLLKRFGVDTNISFDDASKVIDAIAKNSWRKPANLNTLITPKANADAALAKLNAEAEMAGNVPF